MNISKVNYSALNCMKSNCTGLNVSSMGKKKANMEKSVMDAMVLWYDLKKQGATNESMQANPVLVDHSGNGHDANCQNFAWSGMSGIGGYNYDFSSWFIDGTVSEGVIMTKTQDKLIYESFGTKAKGNIAYIYLRMVTTAPRLEVMLNNMQGLKIVADVSYNTVDGNNVSVLSFDMHEGYNEIPETNIDADMSTIKNMLVRFEMKSSSDTNLTVPFTIEQLPLYPGAIVSDGVDDKAVLDSIAFGENWTMLLDCDWIEDKALSPAGIVNTNAIYIYNYIVRNDGLAVFIMQSRYGNYVPANVFAFRSDGLIYDSDYNEYYREGERTLSGGNTALSIFGTYSNTSFTTMALRKFLLFNRALSIDEIKWVKTNLM